MDGIKDRLTSSLGVGKGPKEYGDSKERENEIKIS
jgi:hypothetical protein